MLISNFVKSIYKNEKKKQQKIRERDKMKEIAIKNKNTYNKRLVSQKRINSIFVKVRPERILARLAAFFRQKKTSAKTIRICK